MASALYRQEDPVEDVLDLTPREPVFTSDGARQCAEALFYGVLRQLEVGQNETLKTPYLRIEMVRLVHRFSQTQQSKDVTLRSFLSSVGVDVAADLDMVDLASLPARVVGFTDHLVDDLFLPLKASSARTPQPTPESVSVSTVPRSARCLSTLRQDCLVRDKHRCVITRKFDLVKRYEKDRNSAADDEGNGFSLTTNGDYENVAVAHILPHSLVNLDGVSEMTTARRNALAILDMFDVGVCHLIDGRNIDRPKNAVTLTQRCHAEFGTFHMYFEAVPDAPTVMCTLFLTENHTIDPPLPRLLAIHAAVAKVMHMSGAGAHCEKILRDTEELLIKADGSTNLGTPTALRLGGWWNGIVV